MNTNLNKTIKRSVTLQMVPFFIFIAVVIYSFGMTMTKGDFTAKELLPLPLAVIVIAGFFYLYYRKKLKPSTYWINKIQGESQDLVWLKPSRVKHKMWHVVPVAETAKFELYDTRKNVVVIDSSIMKEGLIIREFMERLPNIHYGYSKEIEKIYKKNPDTFIETLKQKGLYFPISEYEL